MGDLISVVVAAYNGEKYLPQQLESVLGQTYCDLEVIIVDDASNDSSHKIAMEFATRDRRVKVFRNESNIGAVPSFLRAASLSTGLFLCFSDQDDCWRSDKVAILLDLLKKSPKHMLAYSDLEICNENLVSFYPSFWNFSGIKPRKGILNEKIFLRNITPGCSMMIRREVKDALSKLSFDMPFMHDHMVFILAAALGSVVFTREALVKYRQHCTNSIGVFNRSIFSKERFVDDLRAKIVYFKRTQFNRPHFNLGRLEHFMQAFQGQDSVARAGFVDYFLFLRNDTFREKTFGFIECLFPTVWSWLRSTKCIINKN